MIALYFELAGRRSWPDYRFYGLSSKTRYDGKAAIRRPCDRPTVLVAKDDTKLRSVEFKRHATEVIRDFERKQKWTNEIALVIAWDEGDYTSQQYKFYDIEHSKASTAKPSKVFPGVRNTSTMRGKDMKCKYCFWNHLSRNSLPPQVTTDDSRFTNARQHFVNGLQIWHMRQG